MRLKVVVVAFSQLILIASAAAAQQDSVSHPAGESTDARVWIIPVGIVAAAALDPEIREWTLRGHRRSLDHFAKTVNHFGTARSLVPAMVLTYVSALLTGRESLATATLNVGAAYLASDVVESALKPAVGRERPHVRGDAHRFHPFTARGDWHSFPSAHAAHITSIAQAISMQTQSGPITALCGSLVVLVAWDRVYEDQHWTSDVIATIALSSFVSRATLGWIQSRRSGSRSPSKGADGRDNSITLHPSAHY